MAEDHRETPAGAFGVGLVALCPRCHQTASRKSVASRPTLDKMPPKRFHHIDVVDEVASSAVLSPSERKSAQAGADQGAPRRGCRAIACRTLLKVSWAARLERFDGLRVVNHYATKATTSDSTRDSTWHRLVGTYHPLSTSASLVVLVIHRVHILACMLRRGLRTVR